MSDTIVPVMVTIGAYLLGFFVGTRFRRPKITVNVTSNECARITAKETGTK